MSKYPEMQSYDLSCELIANRLSQEVLDFGSIA